MILSEVNKGTRQGNDVIFAQNFRLITPIIHFPQNIWAICRTNQLTGILQNSPKHLLPTNYIQMYTLMNINSNII